MPDWPEWMLKAAAEGQMRPLDPYGVPCPERRCSAAVRTPCFTGEHPDPARKPHQSRIRAAIAADSFRKGPGAKGGA